MLGNNIKTKSQADGLICLNWNTWSKNMKLDKGMFHFRSYQIEKILSNLQHSLFSRHVWPGHNRHCHSKCNSLVPTNNTPIQFIVRYAHVWIWLHMYVYKHTCLECTWGSWKRRLGKKRGPAFCVMTEQTLLTFKSSCTITV